MAETWNKKEREKKKLEAKKNKAERKLERKEKGKDGNKLESMMAYLDEYGNIVSSPPDPSKKIVINAEDIEIGIPKQEAPNPDDLIRTGVVTFFNEAKGYGFIRDAETRESIFVHVSALTESISENTKVTFETEKGPRGLTAIKVKPQQ